MIVGTMCGTLLSKVINLVTEEIDDLWQSLIALFIMLLALALIAKRARDEWNSSKAAKTTPDQMPTATDELT